MGKSEVMGFTVEGLREEKETKFKKQLWGAGKT